MKSLSAGESFLDPQKERRRRVESLTVLLRAAGTEDDAEAEHPIMKDCEAVAMAQQHLRHFTF